MSSKPIVSNSNAVCLVGGATIAESAISAVFSHVSGFVAVDGGANHLLKAGVTPMSVIGDLDSLSDEARATFANLVCHVAEQSTTDFEKALARVNSPMVLCLGFTGGRMDHILSVLNVMAQQTQRAIVLIDDNDVCFVARLGQTTFQAKEGTRISIMPLGAATVTVTGLVWNFSEKLMSPDGFTSPSNEASGGDVNIHTQGPVLVTLPRSFLPTAMRAAVREE